MKMLKIRTFLTDVFHENRIIIYISFKLTNNTVDFRIVSCFLCVTITTDSKKTAMSQPLVELWFHCDSVYSIFNERILFTCLTLIIWMKRKTNKREIVRKWTVNKHSDLLCVLQWFGWWKKYFLHEWWFHCDFNECWRTCFLSRVIKKPVLFCDLCWSLMFDICSLTVASNRCNHVGHLFSTVCICSHNFFFLLFSKCYKRE